MSSYDPGAFQDFERDGWNEVAAVYAELVDGLQMTAGPSGAAILDAAEVGPGRRVLDVASGPGYLVDLAQRRGAAAVGIDISESMVTLARRRVPAAEFHVGPAEQLPFPDASFDAVVSAWGLPHFADHAGFFAEAHRVLRPGGRLSLGTWCPPPTNQFFAVLLGALAGNLTVAPDLPPGPDMFRYADPAVAEAELTAAGFADVVVAPLSFTAGLANGAEDLLRFLASGAVRSRAMYAAQPPETRRVVEASLAEQLARVTAGGDPSTLTLTAVVIAARA